MKRTLAPSPIFQPFRRRQDTGSEAENGGFHGRVGRDAKPHRYPARAFSGERVKRRATVCKDEFLLARKGREGSPSIPTTVRVKAVG